MLELLRYTIEYRKEMQTEALGHKVQGKALKLSSVEH